MNENKDIKTQQKRPEATKVATGPLAFMRDPKKRTIFISAVSLLIVGIIILIIVLSGQPVTSSTEDTTDDKAERKYSLINNGDFYYAVQDDELLDYFAYPLAPDKWTSEIKTRENDDETAPEQNADAKGGIVTLDKDALEKLSEDELGYKADDSSLLNLKKPQDADAADTTGGSKNTSKFSSDRAKKPHQNVLMLYAGESNSAAIKFKSSAFNISAGEFAEISIWVRTIDIESGDNLQISLLTSGADELLFNTIVAESVDPTTTNNGWTEYKFAISANQSAGQTVTLELSLGYATTGTNHPYASGYAFFSDISINYINQKEFDKIVKTVDADDEGADFIKYYNFKSETGIKDLDYKYGNFKDDQDDDAQITNTEPAEGEKALWGKSAPHATTATSEAKIVHLDTDTADGGNITLENHPFPDGSNGLSLFNSDYSSYGVVFNEIYLNVGINRYYKISVWVKTTEMQKGQGASIYLINKNYATSPEKYPSVWFEGIDTTKTSQTNKEQNDGWVEYSFYIQGSGIDLHDYYLELWLGKRGATGATASNADRAKGYAFFANVTASSITMADYTGVSANTTIKTLSIPSKSASTAVTNGSFNTPTDNDLYNYPLNPKNWTLYHAGHNELKYLDQDDYFKNHVGDDPTDPETIPALPREKGDYAAGIINTSVLDADALKKAVAPSSTADGTFWQNALKAAKPGISGPNVLMIANNTATSFGYRSSDITLSAKSYYRISIRVSTFNIGSGGVNLYLTGLNNFDTDEDGNTIILEKDKDTTNFDASFKGITSTGGSTDYYNPVDIFEMAGTGTLATGWTEYSIIIITGEESKTVNLELWLGDRGYTDERAEGTNGNPCFAFFDDIRLSTFKVDPEENRKNHDYKNEFEAALKELGLDLETDSIDDINGMYENLMLFDYSSEETTTEDDDFVAPDPEKDPFKFDWLLVPSIIIVIVLLFAVFSVLFRRLFKNFKHKGKIAPSSDYKRKPQNFRKPSPAVTPDEGFEPVAEPVAEQSQNNKTEPVAEPQAEEVKPQEAVEATPLDEPSQESEKTPQNQKTDENDDL